MKCIPLLCGLLIASTAFSTTTLTVNKPLTDTLTEAQTIQIEGNSQIAEEAIALFKTSLTFTLPSETPVYDDFKSEILVITADTDGTILIADGKTSNWIKTKTKVTEADKVAVKAKGYLSNGVLTFDVTLNDTETVTITSPNTSLNALSEIELCGEGVANGLSLAIVDTAIIPPTTEDKLQDDQLIASYVKWLNEATKGGAMPENATEEEISNAFAMNVGGTPSLQIAAVDPNADETGTVTLQGFTTDEKTNTSSVQLADRNGTIYLVYSETLNGGVSVSAVPDKDIQSTDDGKLIVKLPEGARFVKAAISLKEPEKAL